MPILCGISANEVCLPERDDDKDRTSCVLGATIMAVMLAAIDFLQCTQCTICATLLYTVVKCTKHIDEQAAV